MKSLLEKLADLEHRQWEQWAKKLIETEPNLSSKRVDRWNELFRPYDELPEEWKEYDREWARIVIREVTLYLERD